MCTQGTLAIWFNLLKDTWLLPLIEQAFGFDPKADGYVLQAVGIFGGFYALYVTEKILRIVLKPEHEVGSSQNYEDWTFECCIHVISSLIL